MIENIKSNYMLSYAIIADAMKEQFGINLEDYLINYDINNERFYLYSTKSQSGFFITLDALDV